MPYKYDKKSGSVENEIKKQIIILIASNCSRKFRDIAGALLVEILNREEAFHAAEEKESN